jgi:hypothetical protein
VFIVVFVGARGDDEGGDSSDQAAPTTKAATVLTTTTIEVSVELFSSLFHYFTFL